MRPQNQIISGRLHILDGAGSILKDGVHIEFAFAVGLERIVMAVDEKRGAGQQTGVHAHAFAGISFNYHKAFPLVPIAFNFRFQLLEKCFLKFEDFPDVHTGDQGLSGGDGSVGDQNILEFVIAGWEDGGALVDFGGVEEIENG